jgi:ABC-type multidrug transport system ATPase subunit
MRDIYGRMGVCPQHSLLWDSLTAREHLQFYGRLKGLRGNAVRKAEACTCRDSKQ